MMSPQVRHHIQEEVNLIQRFADSYRRKFSQLIDQLNRDPSGQSQLQCMRLCVEAVNMLLSTQDNLAKALRDMSDEDAPPTTQPRFRRAA